MTDLRRPALWAMNRMVEEAEQRIEAERDRRRRLLRDFGFAIALAGRDVAIAVLERIEIEQAVGSGRFDFADEDWLVLSEGLTRGTAANEAVRLAGWIVAWKT